MIATWLLFICINQGLNSPACTQTGAAYYTSIDGNTYVDSYAEGIDKKYIEPLPGKIKAAAIVASILYEKKITLPITNHVSTSYGFNNIDGSTNTTLNFKWNFP